MKRIDDRIVKVKVSRERIEDGLPIFPWNFLPDTPPQECAFDAYHGTVGFDVFPFAITTRTCASDTIFLKVYEETD